jgi:hypothetical protein
MKICFGALIFLLGDGKDFYCTLFYWDISAKEEVILTQKSWKPMIEPGLRVQYYTLTNLWKIIGKILHMTLLFIITNSRILLIFCMCFMGSVSWPSQRYILWNGECLKKSFTW